jgi:hypothetical protein
VLMSPLLGYPKARGRAKQFNGSARPQPIHDYSAAAHAVNGRALSVFWIDRAAEHEDDDTLVWARPASNLQPDERRRRRYALQPLARAP